MMGITPVAAAQAAVKEGGKKGVDLAGVSAMGGVAFFNLAVDTPEGDLELLEFVLEGANVPVDESAEERKGGAGDIGGCLGAGRGEPYLMACSLGVWSLRVPV